MHTLMYLLFLHNSSLPVIIRKNSVKVDIGVLFDIQSKYR